MLKFLCLLFFFADIANAISSKKYLKGERTLTFHSVGIFGEKEKTYVDVSETGGKTEIAWKEEINQISSPLRAEILVRFPEANKREYTKLDNLCEKYEEGTFEGNAQELILKITANIEKCPIQKGTTSSVPQPFTMSYSTDNPICGDVRTEFKLFIKRDSDDSHPLITGILKGTVTGC